MENTSGRAWCFTLNNPTDGELQLERLFEEDGRVQYGIWQLESGESGTRHIQGYLEFKKRIRFAIVRTLLFGRAHVERRRGTQAQAQAYCQKDDTRVSGPYSWGTPFEQGKRSDVALTMERIRDGCSFQDLLDESDATAYRYSKGILAHIAMRDQQSRNVIRPSLIVTLLWGDPGTGKTRAVYDEHGLEDVYTLTTGASGAVWFDGYEGQPVLLIDDFRGFIPFQFLLKILDIYPLRLDIKGSFTYAAWSKVYITSNHAYDDWYKQDSNHCINALSRRIHRTIHYSGDHPWRSDVGGLPVGMVGDPVPVGPPDLE